MLLADKHLAEMPITAGDLHLTNVLPKKDVCWISVNRQEGDDGGDGMMLTKDSMPRKQHTRGDNCVVTQRPEPKSVRATPLSALRERESDLAPELKDEL